MTTECLWAVIRLGENSLLKTDLNRAVMALCEALESHFRPHVCLNGEEGVRVLEEISPTSNTEVIIRPHLVVSGIDAWLNVKFDVFLNELTQPTNVAELSPRQSAFVVQQLSGESRVAVLEKVKRWYFEYFLPRTQKALASITEQFASGEPMLASDDRNRIFDIHGGRYMDVPYTESGIVGGNLFWAVCFGRTMFEQGEDGLAHADQLILARHARQKDAVQDILGLFDTRGVRR